MVIQNAVRTALLLTICLCLGIRFRREQSLLTAANDEGEIIRYEWVIDGTDGRGETVTTVFDEAGTYDIELTVTNDFAGNDTTTTTITVVDELDEETAGADENTTDDSTDVAGGDEPTPEDRTGDTVPGFGVLVSLGALLAVAARSLRHGR